MKRNWVFPVFIACICLSSLSTSKAMESSAGSSSSSSSSSSTGLPVEALAKSGSSATSFSLPAIFSDLKIKGKRLGVPSKIEESRMHIRESSQQSSSVKKKFKQATDSLGGIGDSLEHAKLVGARLVSSVTYDGHLLDDNDLSCLILAWQEKYDVVMKGGYKEEKISMDGAYAASSELSKSSGVSKEQLEAIELERVAWQNFCEEHKLAVQNLKNILDGLAKLLFEGSVKTSHGEKLQIKKMIEKLDLAELRFGLDLANLMYALLYKCVQYLQKFSKKNDILKGLQENGKLTLQTSVGNAKQEVAEILFIISFMKNFCSQLSVFGEEFASSLPFMSSGFLFGISFNPFDEMQKVLTSRLKTFERKVEVLVASRKGVVGDL